MSRFLEPEERGHVLVLRMNRPEHHNALGDREQFDEFEAVCREANRDTNIRVVVLTGNGPSFCAGGNVKDMTNRTGVFAGAPYDLAQNYRAGYQRIAAAVYGLEVPSIAAVNGSAIGAGCDLACMCDIRLASERASFAESFVRLGIVSGVGGAWLLPRVVGLSRASEMAFTGDAISAAQANEYGLVSRVVPHDQLVPEALALAERIATNPPHALRLGKRLLRAGQHLRFDDLLELSASYQALAHHTDDHVALMQALRDRPRPPKKQEPS
jgi:enoyl-CoA hydratase/carnithine racemase